MFDVWCLREERKPRWIEGVKRPNIVVFYKSSDTRTGVRVSYSHPTPEIIKGSLVEIIK